MGIGVEGRGIVTDLEFAVDLGEADLGGVLERPVCLPPALERPHPVPSPKKTLTLALTLPSFPCHGRGKGGGGSRDGGEDLGGDRNRGILFSVPNQPPSRSSPPRQRS